MTKLDQNDTLRVTLSIGFIGIILTSLYILKEFYSEDNSLVITIFKTLLNVYGVFIIIFFFIFLLIKASSLRFKEPYKIYDYQASPEYEKYFYDTSIEYFGYFIYFAIFLTLLNYFIKLVTQKFNINKIWGFLISGVVIFFILVMAYIIIKKLLTFMTKRYLPKK